MPNPSPSAVEVPFQQAVVSPNAIISKPSIFGPLTEDKRVLIFAGVRGCGKTERLVRMLQGLGEDATKTGVLITEIQGASPSVDLSRLPKEITDTVGIEGCACCAANRQLIDELAKLETKGRKFFLIEQSGYSDAAELARTLKARGYKPAIVAVVNPDQLSSFESHQYRHVRAGQVILASHLNPGDSGFQTRFDKLRAFVKEAASEGKSNSIIVDNLSPEALKMIWERSTAVWEQAAIPLLQIPSGPIQRLGILFGVGDSKNQSKVEPSGEQRKTDVKNFSEVLLFLHSGLTAEELTQRLQNLRVEGDDNPVSRAKGVINGCDVDIIRLDGGRLELQKKAREFPSTLFGRRDYVCVSSTNPFFKELSLTALAQRIGIIDLTEDTINAIRANYPKREDLFHAAMTHNDMLVIYPEDRNLDELLHVLPNASKIEDKAAIGDLGFAVADLLFEHMRLRTDIMEVLDSEYGASLKDRDQIAITVGYTACRVLYHPQLAAMIAADGSYLGPQAQALQLRNPAQCLVYGIIKSPGLAINGEVELVPAQIEAFKYMLRGALEDGSLSKVDLGNAAEKIDGLVQKFTLDQRLGTWQGVSTLMRELTAK